MKLKWLLTLVGAILGLSIAIAFFIVQISAQPSYTPTELAECNPLLINNQDGINILIMSDKQVAEDYLKYLTQNYPFNQNNFNFYHTSLVEDHCNLYRGQALLCTSDKILERASSCPHDYLFVAKEEKPSIRSAAYLNIASINTNHKNTVLLHEFGHIFANLAEEYVEAGTRLPRNSKNCVSQCEDFNGLEEGCFEGCTSPSLIRSIENGVMRTLSSASYGSFNEEVISVIMSKAVNNKARITGASITDPAKCEESSYLLVTGEVNDRGPEIRDVSLRKGCSPEFTTGDYSYILDSTRGNFNPEFLFTDVPDETDYLSGETYTSEIPFSFAIPYYDGENLEIYDNDGNLFHQENLQSLGEEPCLV